jgi:NTE family protein
VELTHPDILIDIQLNRYKTFDFDKSERLIAIGRNRTARAISEVSSGVFML